MRAPSVPALSQADPRPTDPTFPTVDHISTHDGSVAPTNSCNSFLRRRTINNFFLGHITKDSISLGQTQWKFRAIEISHYFKNKRKLCNFEEH